jgi:60 kDa SS-A/Ro ribonucleoprotein
MGAPAGGLPITCREACAAIGLVTLNVEKNADVIGFSDGRGHGGNLWGFHSSANSMATRLDISPRRRLDDVCSYMAGLNFGRTDCALPMLWASKNKLDFDAIRVYTDNETWYGQIHPWQALKHYRDQVGHDVKFSVVAMTATGTSIADPNDASSMDVAGFDTTVPQVLSDFAAGRI